MTSRSGASTPPRTAGPCGVSSAPMPALGGSTPAPALGGSENKDKNKNHKKKKDRCSACA
jgi:hypothetical protein